MDIIITVVDGTNGYKTNIMYGDKVVYQTMTDKRIEADKLEKVLKAVNISVRCDIK